MKVWEGKQGVGILYYKEDYYDLQLNNNTTDKYH